MPAGVPNAYLVVRRDEGFGDVHPLTPGVRYTIGRSPTSRIVLRDDLCSREHAEVYWDNNEWHVRDLGSLNGSRLNEQALRSEKSLKPADNLQLGRTTFLFLLSLDELPAVPTKQPSAKTGEQLEIKQRLTQTRYLAKQSNPRAEASASKDAKETKVIELRQATDNALAALYRMAMEVAVAETPTELVEICLDALLEIIPAEVGAVLAVKEGKELELLAYRHRDANIRAYHKVSQFVSTEVLHSKEAVLAEDVSLHRHLRQRESLTELHVSSLICAPVLFEGTTLGLIHLYTTERQAPLGSEDLEFALAVARHLGVAWYQLRRRKSLSVSNESLRDQLRLESELIGESPALRVVETQIARVAGTNAIVLIRGESGSGKELVARAIHYSSPRRDNPLICLNCAALTESLLESELFGHEKGAFTGATEKMIGKFEAADQGTLFLDEIGEMALSTQAKFLRVLEGHPFERVGGHTPIKVDVRVVAATNRPLEEAVRAGTFRRDLFYRLQVVEITVPPLRERLSDVPLLAEHFLKRFVRETGRKIRGFSPAALAKLQKHLWPGNVRELRNVIERAVALSSGTILDASDIWLSNLEVGESVVEAGESGRYEAISIEEMEKRHISKTLEHTDWNKSQAAAILGIERSTLDRKIKAYGIKR